MRSRIIWDRYWVRVLGGSLVLFLILPAVVRKVGGQFTEGVLIGTGVAVLWYTVETFYARREMIRPLLITAIEERVSPTDRLPVDAVVIRNIGRGPALFVRMADVVILKNSAGRRTVQFKVVDIIEPRKRVVAEPREYVREETETGERVWRLTPALKPGTASDDYQVVISYEDLSGRDHQSVMQMGKSGIRLLRHR